MERGGGVGCCLQPSKHQLKRDELCRDPDNRIRANGQKDKHASFIRCEEKCSKNLGSGDGDPASPYCAFVGEREEDHHCRRPHRGKDHSYKWTHGADAARS